MLKKAGAGSAIPTSLRKQAVLIMTVWGNHLGTMEVLLNSGFDVNEKNILGETPLHFSSREGSEAMTRMLLEAGANANAEDAHGCTPLFNALGGDDLDAIAMLLPHSDLSLRTNQGETALHIIVTQCPHEFAQKAAEMVIGHGVNLNARDNRMQTVLGLTCFWFQQETMKVLLAAGCDVNILGPSGENVLNNVATAVSSAGHKGEQEMAAEMGRLLIEAGIDLNGGDVDPLISCIFHSNFGLLKALLQANCETKGLRHDAMIEADWDLHDGLQDFLSDAFEEHYMHITSFLYLDCCCDPEDQNIQEMFFVFCGDKEEQQFLSDFCGDHEEALTYDGIDLDRPPLSLTRLCRVALRSSLPRGRSFQSAVDQLPLPSLLKDFVGLRSCYLD